jgi:hypothetical protein
MSDGVALPREFQAGEQGNRVEGYLVKRAIAVASANLRHPGMAAQPTHPGPSGPPHVTFRRAPAKASITANAPATAFEQSQEIRGGNTYIPGL